MDRRPRNAGGRVVPGESELVAAVVLVRHQVDELQRVEGEEAVGDTDGDDDPVVGAELACLHGRAIARSVQEGPDVDQRGQGAAGPDDPVVQLATMEVQPAEDTRGGRRQVGLDEARLDSGCRTRGAWLEGAERGRPPELAERAAAVGVPGDRAVADPADAGRRPVGRGHGRPAVAARDR